MDVPFEDVGMLQWHQVIYSITDYHSYQQTMRWGGGGGVVTCILGTPSPFVRKVVYFMFVGGVSILSWVLSIQCVGMNL